MSEKNLYLSYKRKLKRNMELHTYSLDQACQAAWETKCWIKAIVQVNAWSADLLTETYKG